MQNSLASREQHVLAEQFRFTNAISPDRKLSIPVHDLLKEDTMTAYLNQLAEFFPSASSRVIASQFSKRYSFMILTPSLYSLTMFNKHLIMSMENCHIESAYNDSKWLPKIRLQNLNVTCPESESRETWMNDAVSQIFADHLAKIWHTLSKIAHLPMATLWENAAIYVYWLYEIQMLKEADEQIKKQIHCDFQYLLYVAAGDLFGTNKNPLKKFNNKKCQSPLTKQLIRGRNTCCLYYKISSEGDYCSTCPKLFSKQT